MCPRGRYTGSGKFDTSRRFEKRLRGLPHPISSLRMPQGRSFGSFRLPFTRPEPGSTTVTTSTSESTESATMEGFFVGLSPKDRSNIEKHLAACDAEPTPHHGRLWRRLALGMRRLGPLRPQTTGQRAVQFYAPDGKYRLQVFALEDTRDGTIALYSADVLDAAVAAGVLQGPVATEGDALLYESCELPGVTVKIEMLS